MITNLPPSSCPRSTTTVTPAEAYHRIPVKTPIHVNPQSNFITAKTKRDDLLTLFPDGEREISVFNNETGHHNDKHEGKTNPKTKYDWQYDGDIADREEGHCNR